MSYCTKVRIGYYLGEDSVTEEMLVAAAKAILDDLNAYADDVYEDLAFGFERGYTEFQDLRADHFTELFKAISRRSPTVTLCIWGHGEDPRDVWTRAIRNGGVTFSRGPYYNAGQLYRSPPEHPGMSVAVRRVPPGWRHPKDDYGDYLPMFDEDYDSASLRWIEELTAWERGEHPARAEAEADGLRFFWDYAGPSPDRQEYRPKFDAEPTCYQLYETVSVGTPISPVFATREEFMQYLLGLGHSERAVRVFLEKGFAPSMYMGREGIDVWDVLD